MHGLFQAFSYIHRQYLEATLKSLRSGRTLWNLQCLLFSSIKFLLHGLHGSIVDTYFYLNIIHLIIHLNRSLFFLVNNKQKISNHTRKSFYTSNHVNFQLSMETRTVLQMQGTSYEKSCLAVFDCSTAPHNIVWRHWWL